MRRRFWKLGLMFICLTLLQACANLSLSSKHPLPPPADLLSWYRGPLNHLEAVRKGPCPMHPSCSQYCSEAIKRHGPLMGWMMAVDRLMRCGRDEMRFAPRIRIDGRWKFYDPVESNDFWWYRDTN